MVAQSVGRGGTCAPCRPVAEMAEAVWIGDFMAGVLPSGMTFSRGSAGGCFDASGTWQVLGNDVPRFDYEPVTSALHGLLMEEGRTNSLRNGVMSGVTVGKVNGGAGGVLPSHWGIANNPSGDVWMVGSGTEFGLEYVDIRFAGSPVSGTMLIRLEETTQVAAANGQVWTASCFMRIVAGGLTNVGAVGLRVEERNSSGGAISFATADSGDVVDGSFKKIAVTRTFSNATAAFALSNIRLQTLGGAIDITLRVYGTQLERGGFATSYVKTNGAAASRAADGLVKAQAGLSKGALVAQAMAASVAADMTLAAVSDNTTSNAVSVGGVASSAKLSGAVVVSGSSQANMAVSGAWAAAVPKKVGVAWQKNDFELAAGTALVNDSAGNVPVTSQIDIGKLGNASTGLFNGWVRRVVLYRDRLENGRLQELVKG